MEAWKPDSLTADASGHRGSNAGTLAAVVNGLDEKMSDHREEWAQSRDELICALKILGFPEELGNIIAKYLGSPKAIERMTGYLYNVKPKTEELIVDEMLSIRSEIDAWRERKASREANQAYNMILYYGLDAEE